MPSVMSIDYIRIYQPKNAVNIGCDPNDFPTRAYVDTFVIMLWWSLRLTEWSFLDTWTCTQTPIIRLGNNMDNHGPKIDFRTLVHDDGTLPHQGWICISHAHIYHFKFAPVTDKYITSHRFMLHGHIGIIPFTHSYLTYAISRFKASANTYGTRILWLRLNSFFKGLNASAFGDKLNPTFADYHPRSTCGRQYQGTLCLLWCDPHPYSSLCRVSAML